MITYEESGVNINEGNKLVNEIKKINNTTQKGMINTIGSFASLFDLNEFNYKRPVLVSGTDGIGTKLSLALKFKKYNSIGIDCVAMCVNDILCHGAKPLFFLDYLACDKLHSDVAAELISGIVKGCSLADCSLAGGETAEMPGVYLKNEYDIAGFCLGVVEYDKIVNGKNISKGDLLVGLSSSGLHSNGFSLVRKVVKDYYYKLNGIDLIDILLKPTIIYSSIILELLNSFEIKGMAHITGGGLFENIPRMFFKKTNKVLNTNLNTISNINTNTNINTNSNTNLKAEISSKSSFTLNKPDNDELNFNLYKDAYPLPSVYEYLKSLGISESELYKTFNVGIGFVLCVSNEIANQVVSYLCSKKYQSYIIGEIV